MVSQSIAIVLTLGICVTKDLVSLQYVFCLDQIIQKISILTLLQSQ